MKTNLRKKAVTACQTCGFVVAISLTTLGSAIAQPVPTTFTRITNGAIVTVPGLSSSAAWGDNCEGWDHLFVTGQRGEVDYFYQNNGVGGLSNRAAIGAKVRVQAQNAVGALTWQMREILGGNGFGQNRFVAHFGLGGATIAQTVRIEWPSGIVQTLTNVAAKQLLTVTEPPLLQAGLTNGNFQLLLTGGLGLAYEIQASTNLSAWTSLGTITNTTRTMSFVDPTTANQPQRFYRAVLK